MINGGMVRYKTLPMQVQYPAVYFASILLPCEFYAFFYLHRLSFHRFPRIKINLIPQFPIFVEHLLNLGLFPRQQLLSLGWRRQGCQFENICTNRGKEQETYTHVLLAIFGMAGNHFLSAWPCFCRLYCTFCISVLDAKL